MRIHSFATSNPGMVRKYNEDSFLANDQEGIYLVADGMGGLSKGDVASRMAIETVEDFIKRSRAEDITWPIIPKEDYSTEENRLLAAISLANWSIYSEFQRDEDKAAMGTTLVGLLLDGHEAVVASIGDSRIYLVRDNAIKQITTDHSLVMDEVKKGFMTLEEARRHPQKHVINRALGIADSMDPDIFRHPLIEDDLFLLCSDGLSDMLSDQEILSLAQSHGGTSLKELGEGLIVAANDRGGRDNSTVVLVRVC